MSVLKRHPQDSQETRTALLEQTVGHIANTLARIESRLDKLDTSLNERMDKLDISLNERMDKLGTALNERMDKLDTALNERMDKLDNRLWQIMFLISSSILAIVIGKILHWL